MHRIRLSLLLGGVSLTLAGSATAAVAAPATVQLRIEGPTTTLFEGPVTTDVRTFHFTGDATEHQCDGTTLGGTAGSPQPTRASALMAAEDAGLTLAGSFSAFGASFTSINGVNVDYDPASGRFLAEYLNGQFASLGACSEPVKTGDDVLFAYDDGSSALLGLSGATTIAPGQTATLKVADQTTSAAVSGASVDGHTSAADGTVTVGPYTTLGDHKLKATKAASIRSNAVNVCVTDGADGLCGTTKPGDPPPVAAPGAIPDTAPPVGAITSITEHQRFAKGQGPRTLTGTAADQQTGIDHVSLRLTRTYRGRCRTFLAGKTVFAPIHCGAANGIWFKVGSGADWSYLLPAALGPGRYVLDVRVTDKAHNYTTALHRGQERVVFTVG